MVYYVIGGEYVDTSWSEWAGTPEVLGPFFKKDEAERVWRERSMKHVDECMVRYTIRESDDRRTDGQA